MCIYEDNIKDDIWSGLLENYEFDICKCIANNTTNAETEDEYEDFIENCIREVVDDDEFYVYHSDALYNATIYTEDCEEYLIENGLEDSINDYINNIGFDGCFSLQDCAIFNISESMDYDYDDCICDILYGFIEMKRENDDESIQCIVERIREDYNE